VGFYYADDIIRLLYGDSFAAAASVLRIMIWAIPLAVIGRGFRQTLMAGAIIQPQLIGAALSAAVHFLLAWWLIPEWGLRGAAVANISAYVVLAVTMFAFVYWKFGDFPLTWRMPGPILATVAGLITLTATDQWPWAMQLTLGLLVYGATALLTGTVTRNEVNTLLKMLPGTNNGADETSER
jgi:O-antigen/teichoic acid export membrane protein